MNALLLGARTAPRLRRASGAGALRPFWLACLAVAPAFGQAQPTVTVPTDAGQARVTVHSDGIALITDRRKAGLPAGRALVRFIGLSDRPQVDTLQVRFAPDPRASRLVSLRLVPGVSWAAALPHAFVGQEVTWIPETREGGEQQPLKATLLEVDTIGHPTLLRVGKELLVRPAGRLVLPDTGNLPSAVSLLEMEVESAAAGEREIEVAYLAEGWSWEARAVLAVAQSGDRGELSRGIRVGVSPSALLPQARVLVTAEKSTEERAVLYEVPLPLTFGREGGSARSGGWITLGRPVPDLALREALVLNVPFTIGRQGARQSAPTAKVVEAVRFENSAENGLGEAMPEGNVVVYRRAGDALRYCGTVALAATPDSGTIELPIRPAPGLAVAAKVVGTKQLNPLTVEHTCEVEFRSTRADAAEVLATALLSGNWKIDEHTHDFRKLGEGGVEFRVPVPAGETVKLTYTVEVKSG